MEKVTCDGCRAYLVNFEGSRHQCQLGYSLKCLGLNKFIETHVYGPAEKCPRPTTDEKLKEVRSNSFNAGQ